MICRREMTSPFNQDRSSSRMHRSVDVNAFLNRNLKLPPISSGTNLVQSNRSLQLQQHETFHTDNAVTLPQLDLCSLTLHSRKLGNGINKSNTRQSHSKDVDNPTFAVPRVYSVLPPIGKSCLPSAPSSTRKTGLQSSEKSKQHSKNDPSSKRKRQSSRKTRIKRQTQEETASVIATETKIEIPVVDSKSVETTIYNLGLLTQHNESSTQHNESLTIHILDPKLESAETDLSTVNQQEETKVEPDEDSLLELNNIPREFRLFADVYPVSPPPNEKRARNAVERRRHELREDKNTLIGFAEGGASRRRNATCAELDEALQNAVELLRELFLRKTMEELCMMW